MKNLIPIILVVLVVGVGFFIGVQVKQNQQFGVSADIANITSGDCANATTGVSSTATTTLVRNATSTYRSICNNGIGGSVAHLTFENATTSNDADRGFILEVDECLEMWPNKWLHVGNIWATATTGSTILVTVDCTN